MVALRSKPWERLINDNRAGVMMIPIFLLIPKCVADVRHLHHELLPIGRLVGFDRSSASALSRPENWRRR